LGLAVLLGIGLGAWWSWDGQPAIRVERILAAYARGTKPGGLIVRNPLDGTLFPPEIIAPTFRWEDPRGESNLWLVAIDFADGSEQMCAACSTPEWTPSEADWEAIQGHTAEKPATVTILGVDRARQAEILSAASLSIGTSKDEVGAPIFYREVALPFKEAVLNPAKHIRWRFGTISSKQQPPVVLENLPVCGNCHSFSADGRTLAMEVDSGNDKASYTVAPVEPEIVIDKSKLITWSDYRPEDRQRTFGLLCQVSPDGRFLVGTVKDRALAVPREELAFSQLFFLVKGFLAIYDREKRTYRALPGADDPRFVHTNAVWSPDGNHIVFARSRDPAIDPPELRHIKSVMVPPEAAEEFLSKGKTFLYDLYRIPFNGGQGGQATPIPGASNNGTSNYFPKFSPDGKWIVFCRARSFMLLQPDSELYIVPAEGGEARRLACNTARLNSWHSWSPNGKWLVFSSKVNSPYTQLFLTHIDEAGNSTPAVLLRQFTAPDRAANIPEFVNARPDDLVKIREQFLNDQSFVEIGGGSAFHGNYDRAIEWFRKALAVNPKSAAAYENWGVALLRQNKLEEARAKLSRALELDAHRKDAHLQIGVVLARLGMVPEAVRHYREAIRLDPADPAPHFYLGGLKIDGGDLREGKQELAEAIRLDPKYADAHAALGSATLREGQEAQAAACFRRALECDPRCVPALLQLAGLLAKDETPGHGKREDAITLAVKACALTREQDTPAILILSTVYEQAGRTADAISAAEKAMRLAQAARNNRLVQAIEQRLARLQAPGQPGRADRSP